MSTVLVLRNCKADGTSYKGFKWPSSGLVECSDWNDKRECGGGLHGLLWGHGNWSLLSNDADAIWQVVEVEEDCLIKIDDEKVKFPRGNVVYSGLMSIAVCTVVCDPRAMHGADQTSSGDGSTAASSGDGSTAASSGNGSKAASSGNYSTAEAKGKATIALVAGINGAVSAGENGCFAACWHDGKRNRIAVGYVGEDGIEADTAYRLTKAGKWTKRGTA